MKTGARYQTLPSACALAELTVNFQAMRNRRARPRRLQHRSRCWPRAVAILNQRPMLRRFGPRLVWNVRLFTSLRIQAAVVRVMVISSVMIP